VAESQSGVRHPAEYYTDPENSIGYLARIVFRSFSRLLERGTLTHNVSAGQWRFLRQLWREDGITQRELSERVGMREPTTVVAVKGLEKAGLITRSKTADDRRKTFIHLTPHGRDLELVLAPFNAEIHEIATRGMTEEEVETMQVLMRRVIANLAEENARLELESDLQA
jgi:MarR family transcriptional regulator for hemolysin